MSNDRLTLNQVIAALKAFTPIGLAIESKLELPAEHQITLDISYGYVGEIGMPKANFYLVAQCEIISFYSGESIATRIIAKHPKDFLLTSNKTTFKIEKPKIGLVGIRSSQIIASVVKLLKTKL